MRKKVSMLLALGIVGTALMLCPAGEVQAASAARPVIARVEYEAGGNVDVDFYGRVVYNGVKVRVKDSSGKVYSTRILERDSDELDFRINGVKAGKTYRFTITGIRNRNASGNTSVSGSVRVPSAAKVTIKEVEYDFDDRELSVEFAHRVSYSNTKAVVQDSSGRSYPVRIVERESDDMELRVSGLERGKRYVLKLSGIKHRSASSYMSVTKSFIA